jgi:hypothetical protein
VNWLEVIKLRSASRSDGSLEEFMRSIGQIKQSGLAEVKIFRHAALEMDLTVHLHWNSERPEQNGSSLGIRVAEGLKGFGLTDHSVWIEERT